MIVKGFKTLSKLERKLRAVPAEKRKVIVLVGRHPNEGTINIAQRHHERWEKHGAVVVRIPAEWTPHGFWAGVVKKKPPIDDVNAAIKKIPIDSEVVRFLHSRGFRVPFVNFHGTPHLDPEIFNIIEGVSPLVDYHIDRETALTRHPRFTIYAHRISHPAMLITEFHFEANRKKSGNVERTARRLYNALELVVGQFSLNYLSREGNITSGGIRNFSQKYAAEFEEVLAHLSRTGLKKRS